MTDTDDTLGDAIADSVLDTFDRLPPKQKPKLRGPNCQEWAPLAGVVTDHNGILQCVALATGMKCLPQSKLQEAKGQVLHDQHAEILAVRAFNKFLIDQCWDLATGRDNVTTHVRRRAPGEMTHRHPQPFEFVKDTSIYLYCSEAPCGDSSMELIMQAQADPTPWTEKEVPTSEMPDNLTPELLGRGYFSRLGVVRRKPARSDAPVALSKSCTDKLAMYQCTSVLSSIAELLIVPDNVHLKAIVVPQSQHIPTATSRAFGPEGRFKRFREACDDGKRSHTTMYKPFQILEAKREFAYSRRSWTCDTQLVPANVAAVWTPKVQEALVNGVLQGRKQCDPRGASKICRKAMWFAALQVAQKLADVTLLKVLSRETYSEVKTDSRLDERRARKTEIIQQCLHNWPRTLEDSEFRLNAESESS